jgi:hypothetical protein
MEELTRLGENGARPSLYSFFYRISWTEGVSMTWDPYIPNKQMSHKVSFYRRKKDCSKQVFGSGSISGSGSAWIRINLSCWIRIRIRKMTHKNRKKSRIFMFLNTGCSLLRAERFSCSLGVLYGALGISKLQFLIKKIEIKFPAINFFQF